MEKLVRIKSVGTLQSFQTQTGETVTKVGVVMTDGLDTFEGEAFDKLAISISQQHAAQQLNMDAVYTVQCQMTVREWASQQTGQVNRANSIRIVKIATV